jgi:hypothetical protein
MRIPRFTQLCVLAALLALAASVAQAQTSTFTYQGRLTDGGTPANGTYDFQFKLYDTATVGSGTLQGSPNTITNAAVNVTNGVFTVQLNFGASGFPGADRFLEINVRLSGGPSYTTLQPRQQLTSTPYAIRALSAASADTATSATTATTATNNVLKGGDTMTGALVLSGNPTLALGAATKQYVDSGLSNLNGANLAAGSVTTDKLAPVYGYFYNTSVPATIPAGGSVPFAQTGPVNGIFSFGGGTNFVLPDSGVYEVTWQLNVNEGGALALALNGTELPQTVVGRYTGTTQIVGNVLINANANDVLNVRAASGNPSALTISASVYTNAVTGSLVIKRIK